MALTYRGQERRELRGRRVRRHPLTPKQKARAGEVAVITSHRVDPACRPVAKAELVRGAVLLAGVDFCEGADAGRKVRPVVVIDDVSGRRGATFSALQITSSAMRRGFLVGREYRIDADGAGLRLGRSVVDLDRVIELSASDVYQVVGQLTDDDIEAMARLRPALDLREPKIA
ncbi:MAG: type II toxin-antitoxin system PemK/MazF family toxin [Acidimicrobiales bacterium]|nr:type II toxin-antitoxin system PemK/MazF family toxin [Acidimicrobiales bacterium]